MAILIDELFARLGYKYNPEGLRRFERGIGKARARLDGMSRRVAVVGAGLTGALGYVGKTILSFERKQNELASVYIKETAENLGRLREQAQVAGLYDSKERFRGDRGTNGTGPVRVRGERDADRYAITF